MSRLIDAEELTNYLWDGGIDFSKYEGQPRLVFLLDLIEIVKNRPTIDPVKHGRWVGNGTKRCSVCGVYEDFISAYCPNCGARMDREK